MSPSGDELAGVVDLFGGLTREELRRAVAEAAFRAGDEVDDDALDRAIATALEDYRLVAVDAGAALDRPDVADLDDPDADGDGDDVELLVAGPTAFPEVPEPARDLPLILDVDRRDPDRETVTTAVQRRFRNETARAVEAGDHDRAATLLDVSYDVETWGNLDLGDVRDRLDDALETDAVAGSDPGDGPDAEGEG